MAQTQTCRSELASEGAGLGQGCHDGASIMILSIVKSRKTGKMMTSLKRGTKNEKEIKDKRLPHLVCTLYLTRWPAIRYPDFTKLFWRRVTEAGRSPD